MKRHYPHLFDAGTNVLISMTKFLQGGGDCKTPTLLNVIMIVVELIRGPMIDARVD